MLPKRAFRRQAIVFPWTVWSRACERIDEVEILGAKDGSGRWMLLPLSKAGIQLREDRKKEEAAATAAIVTAQKQKAAEQ